MTWIFLAVAIVAEVAGTLALRMGSSGAGRKWFVGTGAGYLIAFAFFTLVLRDGMPLGVAYGIWAATGVALTAGASRVLFGEPLTRVMVAGIALIIGGVLLVEIGATH